MTEIKRNSLSPLSRMISTLPQELNYRILDHVNPYTTNKVSKTMKHMHRQRLSAFRDLIMTLVKFSEMHSGFEYSIRIKDPYKDDGEVVIKFRPNEKPSDDLDFENMNVEFFTTKYYGKEQEQKHAIEIECALLYDRISSATKVSVSMSRSHPHLHVELKAIVNAFKTVMLPHASMSARSYSSKSSR